MSIYLLEIFKYAISITLELSNYVWKAFFSIQLFGTEINAFMVSAAFDLECSNDKTHFLICSDKGEVSLVDFNMRNSLNEEHGKIDFVKKSWKVENFQKILALEISPFYPDIFLVLTPIAFYLFDQNFEHPFFVSPISKHRNVCAKWSLSRSRYLPHFPRNFYSYHIIIS